MKRTGTLTFHAAHNFGSVLQAYALQQVLRSYDIPNEIINFRTDSQRELYKVFTRRTGFIYWLKNMAHLFYYRSLKRKYDNFENFINTNLVLSSKEYRSEKELSEVSSSYDIYITGSDQIWNPMPMDFSFAYFLPFVTDKVKVAYAASFGPKGIISSAQKQKMSHYLEGYDFVGVRETFSKKLADEMLGKGNSEIVLDPTLLLDVQEWKKLIPDTKRVEGKYILFYTLFADKEIMKITKYLSTQLKMPVVVMNFTNRHDFINPFKKEYSTGPVDFLNLIYNATLVCTSSFHGTVFAAVLNKPFFSIRGLADNRICSLLEMLGLEDRSITVENMEQKIDRAFQIDFDIANKCLANQKAKSIQFLLKALSK